MNVPWRVSLTKRRAFNVIITNIKEANDGNKERIEEDDDSVKYILEKIDANFMKILKFKDDKKRNILMKVCFEGANIELILKYEKFINNAIKMFGGKTKNKQNITGN